MRKERAMREERMREEREVHIWEISTREVDLGGKREHMYYVGSKMRRDIGIWDHFPYGSA